MTDRTPREGTPATIENDIRAIRARMDSTIDEIEFRLSPGQMGGGLLDIVRDVVDGQPTRIATAIRDNPVPVVLIGIGALWLTWAVSRTARPPGPARPSSPSPDLSEQQIVIRLAGLAEACRQGAVAARLVAANLEANPGLAARFTELGLLFDRSAAVIEQERLHRGGVVEPGAPVHPVWAGVFAAVDTGMAASLVFRHFEEGHEGTLTLFREALHAALPDGLRVVVGARFHDLETGRNRLAAVREAML